MLTMSRPTAGQFSRLLFIVVLLAALSGLGASQASAEPTCPNPRMIERADGTVYYGCDGQDPGGPGGSGSGGGGGGESKEPPCDLSLVDAFIGATERYCEGENACWVNNPPATLPEEDTWPPKPSEDSFYVYKECRNPAGDIIFSDFTWWSADGGPSLEELAWSAFGELTVPEFTLEFSPPGRSIIYVDTWWWANGPSHSAIRGSSAAGVVAIAEPNRLEVDPGDGRRIIHCDWVTTESDACTHKYQKASAAGYPARARLVYDVRFENGGAPLELPGLPETLESDWHDRTVPVHEIQAIVR